MSEVLQWLRPRWPFLDLAATWLKMHGTSLVLVGLMVGVAAGSVDMAHWVDDPAPFQACLWIGLGLGILLALSRFKGWFAGLYAVLLGSTISSIWVGHLLITWPAPGWLDAIAPRMVIFGERLAGWVTVLHKGTTLQDTGFFSLLVSMGLWCAVVWLAWWVFRRQRGVEGLLPLAILLGLNVALGNQSLSLLMLFCALGLSLGVYTGFTGRITDWKRRRLDHPYLSELVGDWIGLGTGLAMLISLAAWGLAFLTSADGLRFFEQISDSFKQQTGQTAERLFSGVRPPPVSLGAPSVDLPELAVIGAPPSQSADTIFWVKVNDPPPLPPEARRPGEGQAELRHNWRGAIFGPYNGRGWEPIPVSGQTAELLANRPPPGRYLLEQEYILEAQVHGDLFAVNQPVAVGEGVKRVEAGGADSSLVRGNVSHYTVLSWAVKVSGTNLANAGNSYPVEALGKYLQLPASLPERVKRLAESLLRGGETPFEKAVLVQAYLRQNYRYQLNVPPPPQDRDVVDYFLFDAPSGFCSYFASAMTVLLREQGVPARVVSGYAMGQYDPIQRAYRVAARDAHAWVEVYFPGYGWVEFDPTPSQPGADYGPANSSQGNETLNQQVQAASDASWQPILRWGVGVLTVGLVVMAALWLIRRRPTRLAPAAALYWEARRSLAQAGLSGQASQTPGEYLEKLEMAVGRWKRMAASFAFLTELYVHELYSQGGVKSEQVAAARSAWREVVWERIRFWIDFKLKYLSKALTARTSRAGN